MTDVSHAVIVPLVKVEYGRDGSVTLLKKRGGLAKAIGRSRLRVRLDDLGASVWKFIDGRRSAGQILTELQRVYPDQKNLDKRLGQYLSSLVSAGLVRFG